MDAPAFDFFPERFWFAVEGWTEGEICRYFRLLSQQWMRDGLPADLKELASLARGRLTERLVSKFPLRSDGKRGHPFLEEIRAKQRERIAKRREGAAKTNDLRWKNRKDGNRSAIKPGSLSDSLSDTPSDDSATPERHALVIASESPPLTTHPKNRERDAGASNWPELSEVKLEAQRVMAPPECAEHFWNACEAVGWVNQYGQPLTDWRALFRNSATKWKANEHREKQKAKTPLVNGKHPAISGDLNPASRYAKKPA